MSRRTSMGRQKIEIKKIDREDALQVTFSKRRAGVFKKASELCILCGAEAAIIVFSPSGKAFSFGHPSVDVVIDKFISGNNDIGSSSTTPPSDHSRLHHMIDAQRAATVRDLNRQHAELVSQIEAEKRRGEALAELAKANRRNFWWEAPIEELQLNELEQLQAAMERLRTNLMARGNELMNMDPCSEPFYPPSAGLDSYPFEGEIDPSSSIVPHGYQYDYLHGIGPAHF